VRTHDELLKPAPGIQNDQFSETHVDFIANKNTPLHTSSSHSTKR
jgi:hypothetical protein